MNKVTSGVRQINRPQFYPNNYTERTHHLCNMRDYLIKFTVGM